MRGEALDRRSEEIERGAERLRGAEAHTPYSKSEILRKILTHEPLERGGERAETKPPTPRP